MPKKENYCVDIAAKYGLIVDFEGEPATARVPAPLTEGPDETFSQWRQRVLGPDVTDVLVYQCGSVDGRKRIRNLQTDANATHIRGLFRSFGHVERTKRRKATAEAVQQTAHKLVTVPRDTLEDLLEELGERLQPSVREFFERVMGESDEDIGTEDLLRGLMGRFNDMAELYAKSLRQRPDPLNPQEPPK